MESRGAKKVGDYQLFQKLGEGGMGVVFLARHVASGEFVAVKLPKNELLAMPGGRAAFLRQGHVERALQHTNIVHALDVGTDGDVPYLVMPLMEGGTLAEPENRARFSTARQKADLVRQIARAVQFAHGRGVLHCDLKDENVLFDAAHDPHVSDFGLARSIHASGSTADVGIRGGSPGWMSPEQVGDESLTTASDVFSLGVLLHWLLTDELPFGCGTDFAERVKRDAPPPLPPWSRELDWALLAVAHKAMQKRPEERYLSAAGFANDLERALSHEAIRGWQVPLWGSAWYWMQRHPGAMAALGLLLWSFALVAFVVSNAQQKTLRKAALEANAYAAFGQAAAVLYQLRQYAEVIELAAGDRAVTALRRGPRRVASPPPDPSKPCSEQVALEDPAPLASYSSRFSTMVLHDKWGCARVRIAEEPPPSDYVKRSFRWRDYFGGAEEGALKGLRTAYVRKAYRSSVSGLVKFAVSMPLFERDEWIGVLGGSLTVASTLSLPHTPNVDTVQQLTALVGPYEGEDGSGAGAAPATEFTVLAHPKLPRGARQPLDPALARTLKASFGTKDASQFELSHAAPLQLTDYEDPFLHDRWLAAFAPVGGTGYVVIVQTKDTVATRPNDLLRRLSATLAVASAALVLVGGLFLWRGRQRLG